MQLVDTNILAHLLIDGSSTAAARQLYAHDADWRSEGFILVEMANVLVTQFKAGRCTLAQAVATQERAEGLMGASLLTAAHADTLKLAAQLKTSAYDARFLCIARQLGLRLVTEDTRLRHSAPALTQSLAEALAAFS